MWLERVAGSAAAACALAVAAACSAVPGPEGAELALVYGEDDRKEYYELEDPALRALIANSTVALIDRDFVAGSGRLEPIHTLGEAAELCEGERFAQQPAAALCTGVLVDWDLVLTAGHCLRVLPLDRLLAVFGYYYDAPDTLAMDTGGAFELQEIVAEGLSLPGESERLDYAWVRLKHAAAPPRVPAAIRTRAAEAGEGVIALGAALATPIKADAGGVVRDPRVGTRDYFVADTDTSGGASGGPALDADGELLGVLVRGGTDLGPTDDGCQRMLRVEDGAAAEEQFTYAARALEELCREEPGASSLCRVDCGDPCRALPVEAPDDAGGCATARGRPSALAALLPSLLLLTWRRRR